MRLAAIVISLMLVIPAGAQDPYSTANCEQPTAETWFEVGNVRARIYNGAPIGWKAGADGLGYFVPSTGSASPMFTASFIATGFIDDDVRVSGSSYGPYEVWPGPTPSGQVSTWDCTQYDRFWTLDRVRDFQAEDEQPAPSQAVLDWPVDLGAPFVDRNGVPGYQPAEGDHPAMNGDHQLWWIMNDRGNEHARFKTKPLGIEVRASAFGFDVKNEIGNITFYRYHVTNKGSKTIRDMTLGLHTDFDLGSFDDDRAGTDTTNALWYYYNADNDDDGVKEHGYGLNPPAAGFAVIELSHSAGTLPSDMSRPPSYNLGAARMYSSGGSFVGDPGGPEYLHLLMTGRWRDGSYQIEGGTWGFLETDTGYGNRPMPYWMPGDPVTGAFWSERNYDGSGTEWSLGDRRGIFSTPTFDLAPEEWAQVTFALVWARGSDHLDSITHLRRVTSDIHAAAETLLAPRTLKPPLFEDGNPPETPQFPFWVDEPYPNPADDNLTLRASFDKSGPVSVRISDLLGRTRLETSYQATTAGEHFITLDTSALPPGSYNVTVESWSHRATHSFVVLR